MYCLFYTLVLEGALMAEKRKNTALIPERYKSVSHSRDGYSLFSAAVIKVMYLRPDFSAPAMDL